MHNSYLDMKQLIQEQYMHDKLSSQDNLLEKIWYFHTRCHPIDTAEICEDFSSISLIAKNLSLKKQRQLSRIITDLCVEHERVAFIQGICAGLQLAHEIDAVENEIQRIKEAE